MAATPAAPPVSADGAELTVRLRRGSAGWGFTVVGNWHAVVDVGSGRGQRWWPHFAVAPVGRSHHFRPADSELLNAEVQQRVGAPGPCVAHIDIPGARATGHCCPIRATRVDNRWPATSSH